ncbi:heparinase II/III family protein [Kangiella sp. HZ709]|uniref:heparinase II/III family protein n=1 Tax=Kangiella sp. HZ709 TaxID=2666328 RepID=UPI0018A24368|nr:heparinase II/III family protein [Kangiella sp. HZ709]
MTQAKQWIHVGLYEEKINHNFEATFLNKTKKLQLPRDWNNESPSKLWVYNLHYFEDLLAVNGLEKNQFHIELLQRWIAENPTGFGNGWEPYPTSLRVANILKAWLAGLPLDSNIFKSVFEQASYLSNDLEKHLLGNHYFVNLKALLFAGVVLDNQRWLKIAEEGLIAEIPEQILEDGANFELSPMYHSLILVDMLDMYNLYQSYPAKISPKILYLLELYIPKMLQFMELMKHPDEEVSFFNDSANAIAPCIERIKVYANKLGFKCKSLDINQLNHVDSKKSGYMVATNNGAKVIFDAANVGPDYIPGHAHADTLSFELSIGKERVFVNTGTSEYGLSSNRLLQRKTCSHNTVEVNGEDSSQVWSGFRVAKRARVSNRKAYSKEGAIVFEASHNGYKSIFSGCFHKRGLILNPNGLTVFDELDGAFNNAVARFFIHPRLDVSLEDNKLLIIGDRFQLECDVSKTKALLKSAFWSPEFGQSIENKVLEVEFTSPKSEINFCWVLK